MAVFAGFETYSVFLLTPSFIHTCIGVYRCKHTESVRVYGYIHTEKERRMVAPSMAVAVVATTGKLGQVFFLPRVGERPGFFPLEKKEPVVLQVYLGISPRQSPRLHYTPLESPALFFCGSPAVGVPVWSRALLIQQFPALPGNFMETSRALLGCGRKFDTRETSPSQST